MSSFRKNPPELFKRWWVPKAVPITLLSCEQDVRRDRRGWFALKMPGMLASLVAADDRARSATM